MNWLPRSSAAATAVTAVTFLLGGCGSNDATASRTPEAEPPVASSMRLGIEPTVAAGPAASATAPADPCAVDLAAPEISKSVSDLPRDPRSNQPWSPEPVAGNYTECAQLSAVIVRANTNGPNPNTRAVLYHLGKFIPTGVPDTYGFNGVDAATSTGDTLALVYLNPSTKLRSTVRFHWNGEGVELVGNTG